VRFAAALAVAAVTVACARHDAGSAGAVTGGAEAVTITFVGWGAPEERALVREVVADFEREHPEIRVAYTQVPGVGYDYLNKLRLMMVADMSPDVFYVPDGAFGELVRTGALLDLEPMVRASNTIDLEAIWTTGVERYRYDGKQVHVGDLYALPKDIGPHAMFFNIDAFRARGVPVPDSKPMTWDEAIAMWRALTFEERGVAHYGLTSFPYESAVWMLGGEVLSPDRRSWAMTSPEAVRAVQWCADLALVFHVAPNPARLGAEGVVGRELFEAGLAATHVDGRWMVPRFRKLGFDWDVAPVPVPAPGVPSVAWSGSVGLAIARKTAHAAEAFALVEYLAGPRGQEKLTRAGFQLPNQRAVARTDVYLQPGKRPAHAEVFLASAETSRPSPATETPNSFWVDAFGAFADEIWRGKRPASVVLPEMKPRIDQALANNNERAVR